MMDRIKQGKQEGVDEHNHAKQLETSLQRPQPGTLRGYFDLGKAKVRLNLPGPPIREKDLSRLYFGLHGLICDQIHHPFLHPCFHQKQLLPRLRVAKWAPPEVAGHLLSRRGIPDLFMRSILLSLPNLPQLLFFSRKRQKY